MSEHVHEWVCSCGARRYRTKRMTNLDQRRIALYESGMSGPQIATTEDVTRQAVYATLKKHGISRRRA